MSNPYVKSLIWLVSLGGIGYGLMVLTEPNAEKIEKIRASTSTQALNASDQKKALFMKKLQEAALTREPIYNRPAAEKKD